MSDEGDDDDADDGEELDEDWLINDDLDGGDMLEEVPVSSQEVFEEKIESKFDKHEEKFKDVGEEWRQLSTLKVVFDRFALSLRGCCAFAFARIHVW